MKTTLNRWYSNKKNLLVGYEKSSLNFKCKKIRFPIHLSLILFLRDLIKVNSAINCEILSSNLHQLPAPGTVTRLLSSHHETTVVLYQASERDRCPNQEFIRSIIRWGLPLLLVSINTSKLDWEQVISPEIGIEF